MVDGVTERGDKSTYYHAEIGTTEITCKTPKYTRLTKRRGTWITVFKHAADRLGALGLDFDVFWTLGKSWVRTTIVSWGRKRAPPLAAHLWASLASTKLVASRRFGGTDGYNVCRSFVFFFVRCFLSCSKSEVFYPADFCWAHGCRRFAKCTALVGGDGVRNEIVWRLSTSFLQTLCFFFRKQVTWIEAREKPHVANSKYMFWMCMNKPEVFILRLLGFFFSLLRMSPVSRWFFCSLTHLQAIVSHVRWL